MSSFCETVFNNDALFRPEGCEVDEQGGRKVNLFPEEESGDRMLNQVKFLV